MKNAARFIGALAVAITVVACGPGAATPANQAARSSGQAQPATTPQKTLVILARGEPPSLAAKPFQAFSGSLAAPIRLFNAQLDYVDEREGTHAYLAQALPQVNTDTWRVFPDGTMETTYKLRDGLTWHDGARLTADDFVFAWRVFATPELGVSASAPIAQMAEVRAPDAGTVVIAWKRIFPDAGALDQGFQALPRHILEDPFQHLDAEGFVNHPFWTRDYIGLGPYRITSWEPGSSIDAAAFSGHALGTPKIAQIRVSFTADSNTALAMMLSGDAQFVSDFILFYEEGATLEREWASRGGGGTVEYAPALLRWTAIQRRPDAMNPRQLADARVRRAIAIGMDAQAAVDVTTGGRGLATYTITSPQSPAYRAVQSAIAPRPYDARIVQQLFEEAGFAKGADGFFAAVGGEPFKLPVATDGGATNERENAIFVDSLRQAGVDATSVVIPVAQLRDLQARALQSGLSTGGLGGKGLGQFISTEAPRPENRWSGNNRGGWINSEYDRLYQLFDTSLDAAERGRYTADMERLMYEDVGIIPNLFTVVVNARAAGLTGPVVRTTPDAGMGIQGISTWGWTS